MKATHTLKLKKLLISTALLGALAGCGQSGPLYLPQQDKEQNQPEKTAAPTADANHINTISKQEQ